MNTETHGTSKDHSRQGRTGGRRTNPRFIALRLLAVRSRSVAELTERMVSRGISKETVDTLIQELLAEKLLDDRAFARALVESAVTKKPVGRRYLSRRLQRYGIAPKLADEVLREEFPREREEALAHHAMEKKLVRLREARISEEGQRARLLSHLLQRGFSVDVAMHTIHGRTF